MRTTKRTTRTDFALALGANLGDARSTLLDALDLLDSLLGPLTRAPLYETRPVSPIPQPDFVNTVALGSTSLPPDAVLALAQQVERHAGRRRGGERNAPRPLDVDLLLYGDRVTDEPELTLPHPRLTSRRFVLAPLADVAPERIVPPSGQTVRELFEQTPDDGSVRRLEADRDLP